MKEIEDEKIVSATHELLAITTAFALTLFLIGALYDISILFIYSMIIAVVDIWLGIGYWKLEKACLGIEKVEYLPAKYYADNPLPQNPYYSFQPRGREFI